MSQPNQSLKERNAFSQRNSSGFVWASVGLAITTLTLVGVGWIQRVDPFPIGGVYSLLALGGGPAALVMLLGLWRGFRAKRELLASASGPICSTGIRIAVAGLGLLLLGVAIFAFDCWSRQEQEEQWVAEAQAAVAVLLQTTERIPGDMVTRLGPFQRFTGEGQFGPAWNIQGYHYKIADRDAHFANATIPVRIYVTEGRTTNQGNENLVVQKVNKVPLYLQNAPIPKESQRPCGRPVSQPAYKVPRCE